MQWVLLHEYFEFVGDCVVLVELEIGFDVFFECAELYGFESLCFDEQWFYVG